MRGDKREPMGPNSVERCAEIRVRPMGPNSVERCQEINSASSTVCNYRSMAAAVLQNRVER